MFAVGQMGRPDHTVQQQRTGTHDGLQFREMGNQVDGCFEAVFTGSRCHADIRCFHRQVVFHQRPPISLHAQLLAGKGLQRCDQRDFFDAPVQQGIDCTVHAFIVSERDEVAVQSLGFPLYKHQPHPAFQQLGKQSSVIGLAGNHHRTTNLLTA